MDIRGEIAPLKLLQLRNPWGSAQEWNGDWSDGSAKWDAKPEVGAELGYAAVEDGLFWMSWDDFRQRFDSIEVCKHPMPGKRADFSSLEAAAESAAQLAAVEAAILSETNKHPELADDPIDSIEHKAIVTRALELMKGCPLEQAALQTRHVRTLCALRMLRTLRALHALCALRALLTLHTLHALQLIRAGSPFE